MENHTEGAIHLYQVGEKLGAPTVVKWRRPMKGMVTCVQISPDLARVTGGGFELRSWSLDNEPSDEGPRFSPETAQHVAFEPDKPSNFIVCNPSGALHILHADDVIRVSGERLSPQGRVAGTGFRADGRVFTANVDGTVRIWNRPRFHHSKEDVGTGYGPDKAGAILCVAFRPDGKAVALGSRSGSVFVYRTDGSGLRSFPCEYRPGDPRRAITEVRFSDDGTRVIAHDMLMTPFVFDPGAPRPTPLTGKNGRRPEGVAGDGRTAVFPSDTGTPYVIGQLDPSADIPTRPTFHPRGELAAPREEADTWFFLKPSRVAFSPDRSRVAMLNAEGKVCCSAPRPASRWARYWNTSLTASGTRSAP